MKSKKRHHATSDESEESNCDKSSSSSESESEESSESDHRYKKKRKHVDSSDSESNSEDHKRSKKRKHKKKKKKHGKKKRRSESVISCDHFSLSDNGTSSKKKKKHKHKTKRARTSTVSEDEEQSIPRRLHSVVKERRASSGDGSQPIRTYYQKEYRRSASVEHYDREQEVQRFYRGSSKEHKYRQDHYNYDRQRNEKLPQQMDKFDRNREKFGPSGRYDNPNMEHSYRQRDYDEYKRPRFEDRRPEEHYNKRPREDTYYREDPRANDRYNQYEGPKRREFIDNRDFRERRAPPEPPRYREREFIDKREKPREDRLSPLGRIRDMRRDRPARPDKPPGLHQREPSKSPEDRFRERGRRGAERDERDERAEREERPERGRERRRSAEPHEPHEPHEPRRTAPVAPPLDRKTRFADADDSKEYTWGKVDVKKEGAKGAADKEKPNFGLSGKLTADANTVNGVVIKYREPDDAKQPKRRWRFYPFKGDKALPILYIHRQSCFLLGRDKQVADIPLEHPSVSKQHAALQFRATPFARPDGSQARRVRPYIVDLDSANGTFVNNKKIEPRRYVELLERDVVKFGFSQREYVLLHENSKDDAQDDDQEPPPAATSDQVRIEKRVKEEIAADGD